MMAPKTADIQPVKTSVELPDKPEDQELARKREEQAAIESALADRELQCTNMRLSWWRSRGNTAVSGSSYAELDELKAQVAECLAHDQPGNANRKAPAEAAQARSNESKSAAGEKASQEPKASLRAPDTKQLYREVARRIHPTDF